HGLRPHTGPDLDRAAAEGRPPAAGRALGVDAEHRYLVTRRARDAQACVAAWFSPPAPAPGRRPGPRRAPAPPRGAAGHRAWANPDPRSRRGARPATRSSPARWRW